MSEKGEYPYPPKIWRYLDNKLGKNVSYALETITKESKINENEKTTKRPLALRSERADIYHEIINVKDKEEKHNLIDKAHELDNLFSQFINERKKVEVEINGLGKQEAQYVEIKTKNADLKKTPLVLIPGISNDLDGIGLFPIKLAMATERRIIMIAYPESWYGKVTEEFGKAVKNSKGLETHGKFFQLAIEKLLESEKEFDICGVSAGSIIVSELIKNKNFNNRINQANLITPPGTVNNKNLIRNISGEMKALFFKKFKSLPKINTFNPEIVKRSDEEINNRKITFKALSGKLINEYQWWNGNLISGKGKKTVVISCNQDTITNSKKGIDKVKENESLIVREIDGIHTTPVLETEKVIEQMII